MFALIRRLTPKPSKTISKIFTVSASLTTKPTGPKNVLSESLTVRTKKFIAVSQNIARKFNVQTHRNYIVNLAQQTCTCSIWQLSGYPCGHAISILLDQKEDPQRYVKPSFTIAAYKKIYEQALLPLDLANVNGDAIHSPPTVVSDDEDSESEDSTRRPPGRPRKRRIHGQHDEVDRQKRVFRCSRCGEAGHSCRTCREAINGAA